MIIVYVDAPPVMRFAVDIAPVEPESYQHCIFVQPAWRAGYA